MKRFSFLLVTALSAFCAVDSRAAQDAISLPQVLNMAREENTDIRAARQSWKVSRAQISPARTWPNPTFTYIDEEFPSETEGMPSEKIKHYRLEQMVPFPGK